MNNVREAESSKEILYLNFNQTSTALSVGAKTGYTLYDLDQVNDCRPTFESRDCEDICIIERNFASSLVVFVKLASPRNLNLYNYKTGTAITEKLFPNTVLSVKLNRKNAVVCLEDSIYILYIMELVLEKTHVITGTPPNVKGLTALTYGHGYSLLAYPGSSANGDLQIFDCNERHAKLTIPAHTSQLAALTFSDDCEKIATASIKGTVIRVFSIANGEILFQFRRGVKRCVEINCLYFNDKSEFLCASSNTETIHIFKLCQPSEPEEKGVEEADGWMKMFENLLTGYLPAQVSGVLSQQRSFAYVHLPFSDQKTICTIAKIQGVNYVVVASLDGYLYIYEINTEIGGCCHLVKQHRLEGPLIPTLSAPKAWNSSESIKSVNGDSSSPPTPPV